jgi:hypothetical protein
MSFVLLIPGVLLPVLTIRGVLTRDGIAQVAPDLLQKGISDDTIAVLRGLMNPATVQMLEAMSGGDLKKGILAALTPQITASLQQSGTDVEVYTQTRSIVSAVNRLYEVGSPFAATLILLFSIVVPVTKGLLVALAMFMTGGARERVLRFVTAIAKWSMADVFVVAILIAYLAAIASQATPGTTALVAFQAHFGIGFYFFAAYCVFSLATQQFTARVARATA